ncbi:MAG: NAD+ synthase [Gammaproteobacteria bacterium]|nr:NAD+ synthase [Gammaproteobacteria bacterium]MCP5135496.1 NAD+ synthase [Gammaproteobacteria bacterium]
MTTESLNIAVAQLNLKVGDVRGNVDRVIAAAIEARDTHRADLVMFPELTLTGYPPEDLLLRPGLEQAVSMGLARLCRAISGIDVVLGYPRSSVGGRRNVAGLIRDGEIVMEVAKHNLPNYAVFDEKRYFDAGETGAGVVEVNGIEVGLTVCEDIWFEGPARHCAAQGAELILNINASPFHAGKRERREAEVAKRIAESGLPVVYGNLVGGQDELVFDGESFAMNAEGEVVMRAPAFEEGLYTVRFEQGRLQAASVCEPLPRLASIYRALVLGTRDYVCKTGFSGTVLGLSGGIDSALVLTIAVDALGAENVHAVLMPSRYTADISVSDALAEAEMLDVAHDIVPIEGPFKAFLDVLEPVFQGAEADITEENLQARSRGVILMAISNKQGRMLLTTGNKSEMSVGYATLYGDMNGGYAPLKDCPKLLVYALARYRNAISPAIPERVITRPPSAELRPDQTDQDSLPPYDVLDAILERYIERDYSVTDIIADGFDEADVRRIARLVDINEYKRRQAPPGVRISERAFGRDRRYPIASGYSHVDPARGGHY